VNTEELSHDINSRFGEIIQKITTVDIYLDQQALEDNDYTAEDVVRYLANYSVEDNIPEGASGADRVPSSRLDQRIFAAAFSADYIETLTPSKIQSYGPSTYAEGRFTVPKPNA
jgi:hypothetical protein